MRSEVFPELLGPRRRIEGKVVSPLALKTTEWRKIGIVKTRISAIISPTGEGFIRACAQSCNVDICTGLCDVVKCCIAKAVENPKYHARLVRPTDRPIKDPSLTLCRERG